MSETTAQAINKQTRAIVNLDKSVRNLTKVLADAGQKIADIGAMLQQEINDVGTSADE